MPSVEPGRGCVTWRRSGASLEERRGVCVHRKAVERRLERPVKRMTAGAAA